MATISASTATSAWTAFSFNTTKAGLTKANVPTLENVDFTTVKDVDFDELMQFISLVSAAYAIGWQHARQLVFHAMTAIMNREAPMVATTRTYTP